MLFLPPFLQAGMRKEIGSERFDSGCYNIEEVK